MLKTSEVINYIEKMYDIKLMDYQKEFVKHVIQGDVIYTPRCFGRSMILIKIRNCLKKNMNVSMD